MLRTKHMISGIYWSIGKRSINQDSVAFYQVIKKRKTITFALVADGIGGLQEGEVASGYVAEQLVDWFYEEAVSCKKFEQEYLVSSIQIKLEQISEELKQYGTLKRISLGTTCTAVLFFQRQFLLFHIGDCSAYFIKKNRVKKLTKPHVDQRGALTKCVGSMGVFELDYYVGKVGRKEAIVLCSDGFWKQGEQYFSDMLNPTELEATDMIERRLQMIGDANMKHGGKDNQSAIYMRG